MTCAACAVHGYVYVAGARSYEELIAWQRSHELKLEIYKLIRSGPVLRDREFRTQIRNSAAAAPRLISEGFGRWLPKEFVKYLQWANGELHETSNNLRDGLDSGYFTSTDVARLSRLAKRASKATTGLIRYLQKAKPPDLKPRAPQAPRAP